MLNSHPHTPTHLEIDNTPYFITSTIYQKRPLLASAQTKELLLSTIQTTFIDYGWELHHWVILDNHYHLLGQSGLGKNLAKIFKRIHAQLGFYIHQQTHATKPIWWNYWDYCPRNETDYLIRLNYLLYNPVKHGYVTQLPDYPFSSFHQLMATTGREPLAEQFRTHPSYKTLHLDEDNF